MTDRTAEISEAFDRARDWDRAVRDMAIDTDIDRLTRLTTTMTAGTADAGTGAETA